MKKNYFGKYFSGLSLNTLLLAFASFFSDISTEMLYPVLPVFLTQTLGAGGGIVGIVEGVAIATQHIVQGFSGTLSDKLQKRKPIAIFGYTLSAISKPLIGFAASWQGVLGARFFDRFGTGTRSAPRDALIAASADNQSRGRAFGLEGVGDNLGAFLGPLIAVFILFVLKANIRDIFYLAVIPGLLAVVMIILIKEKDVLQVTKKRINVTLRNLPKAYWNYLFVTVVFGLGNSSNAFLILRTRDVGVSLEDTILIYAGFNLIAALASYPLGFLSDKLGRKNVLLFAFIVYLITYLGFAIDKNMILIAVLFFLYGIFQGTFRSVGKAFASDFVPQPLRASSVGWYATAVGLSGLFASIIAGQLWDNISHTSVFVFGAVFALAGIIALLTLVPKKINTT